jgi:hypothetical protein
MPLYTIVETVYYEVEGETPEEAKENFVQVGDLRVFLIKERVIADPEMKTT